jgi:S-adenosylmethionine:tRNA ribosyltransferase-isomerase
LGFVSKRKAASRPWADFHVSTRGARDEPVMLGRSEPTAMELAPAENGRFSRADALDHRGGLLALERGDTLHRRVRLAEFDYELPPERIAQHAIEPRDAARLFVHDVERDASEHVHVRDLERVLRSGDLLVVNDTRVRSARLIGRRASGGAVELLLVERDSAGRWRALARPAGRLKSGETIELEGGALHARMLERASDADGGAWWLELLDPRRTGFSLDELIESCGRAPLPPYIARPRGADVERDADRARYQTVFARELGAIAAPTAGLHFTPELLERLAARGVERASVTLHVGEGTFRPVTVDDTEQHVMHSERYVLPVETVAAIERCRARGGRVVAVGTTSVRVLESCADENGSLRAGAGSTNLFLVPGARFRVVDALLTNFHLPRSTLLMLVAAFAGRERVLRLYAEAIERGYRFYSYGDAMLLVR